MINYSKDHILLSLQKSLLGYVRNDLRAVTLSYSSSELIIRFVLDHEPSSEDRDFYSEALLDFYADIVTGKEPAVKEEILHSKSSSPELLNSNDVFVFLRYEPNN
ncbi:MAG: hypothetical protein HRT61_02375 [Ekhidna sp.]|nr:hypothetical protein [Ekhidna sp.]